MRNIEKGVLTCEVANKDHLKKKLCLQNRISIHLSNLLERDVTPGIGNRSCSLYDHTPLN